MKRIKTRQLLPWIFAIIFTLFLIIIVNAEAQAENGSIRTFGDAIWYALVTITTVGYGDYYPVTTTGKIFSAFLVLGSFGILGYLVGSIGSRYSRYIEKRKLGQLGTHMKNHVVIIGWDDFALLVAQELRKAQNEVAIITNEKNNIDLIKNLFPEEEVFTLFSDFHNIEAFNKANIQNSCTVFINRSDDSETLITMLNLKGHYKNLNIVVTLNNSELKNTFYEAGVTYAISKNEIASKLVASFTFEPDVAHLTEDIMSTASTESIEHDISQFYVSKENKFVGRNCKEVFWIIKEELNAVLLGISKSDDSGERTIIKNPSEEVVVRNGDYLLIMTDGETRNSLEKTFKIKEGIFREV